MTVFTASRHPVLVEAFEHAALRGTAGKIALVAAGSLALTLSAKLAIPFYPVPMSFQTLVVLVLGVAFGPRLAVAAVLFYLMQGAAGLPVFAGSPERGVGLAYMTGPTGGFLVGFVFAAATTGWLARRGWSRSVPGMALAMAAGTVALYVPGILWLGFLIGWDKPVLEYGLWPFLYGDALKLAIAAIAAPAAWRVVDRMR
ncbi:biotin transporter BioY [Mesorhizobium sp. CAU 1732]|uniref:biotin transporter BioY n=1 Tax=Mesorhizobium sp. CAU 1732 TaxID=3140358 RepID=UPI003260D2AE